jgi:hypothetical protein
MTTRLTQTITDAGGPVPGDCWRTAIACLLDLREPTDAPHFIHEHADGHDTAWWEASVAFVADRVPAGQSLVLIKPRFPVYEDPENGNPHVIATGPSPRGDWLHSVVVDARTGELVWDPHPSRAGLAGPVEDVAVIGVLADGAMNGADRG